MDEKPQGVGKTFERIKSEYPFIIHLRKVNGHYYVYRQISKAEYIGRIDNNGKFIKKMNSSSNESKPTTAQPNLLELIDRKDILILKSLSMNPLMPLNHMSKIAGIPTSTLETRIKNLEERLGIKYFADIDVEKLGYLKYLITVKFRKESPTVEELKAAMDREPRVQLAMLIKGSNDVLIYALGRNIEGVEPIDIVTSLRRTNELIKYDAEWNSQPFYEHFGAVPLREIFFDKILETRVFKRTKDKPRPNPTDISRRQFIVLKELATKNTLNFSEIERRYNLPRGSAKHVFTRLKESGYIRRMSITMTKLPVKYTTVIFRNVVDEKSFVARRKDFLSWIIEYTQYPTNKFSLAGDTTTPDGSILFMPVFNEIEANKELNSINDKSLGMQSKIDIVLAMVIGEFCYRYFDITQSTQHRKLKEKYQIQETENINYETTKLIKKELDFRL